MEAEMGVLWPQAKENQAPQQVEKTRKDPPLEPMEGAGPADRLILDLALRT